MSADKIIHKEPRTMKWTINRIILTGIVFLAVVLSCTSANAQQRQMSVSLNFSEYDVMYLTDFVDIRNQQLNPNISGISLNLNVNDNEGIAWVSVRVDVFVQLRGESNELLVTAFTNNFPVSGSRILAARDFAQGGSSEVYVRNNRAAYIENATLRKKLEDMASKNPTAPPGKYTVSMKVLPATSSNPSDTQMPSESIVYASDTKTVIVQFSTADEVFVEITDPKNGSFLSNLAPTFSWTSSAPVKVSVYEALPNNRSPQDALTGGNPNLVRKSYGDPPDFNGTSLTYPSNAERNLEQNKAYVLQVEARVATNRGDIMRQSLPVVFRITDDKIGQMVDNFLNAFSGAASTTYSTLRAEPTNWVAWSAYGNITLDGSTLTETDLQTLINDLAGRSELKLQLSIENQ
jgi:hypothetical protein